MVKAEINPEGEREVGSDGGVFSLICQIPLPCEDRLGGIVVRCPPREQITVHLR